MDTSLASSSTAPSAAAEAMRTASSDRRILYTPEDAGVLTDLVCLTRQQIEAFAATPQDIADRAHRGGPTQHIPAGRVGIRCIHCSHLPVGEQANGAVAYPPSIGGVYQAVRNWQRYHFGVCTKMPAEVRGQRQALIHEGSYSNKPTKDHWTESCERMGMSDAEDGTGIFFSSTRFRFESATTGGSEKAGNDDGKVAVRTLDCVIGDGVAVTVTAHNRGLSLLSAAAEATVNVATDDLPPPFTAQDELREMAALRPIDVDSAEDDLRGITSGLADIDIGIPEEDWRKQHLIRLDSELEKIPLNERSAYLQAAAQCPELVNDEHKIAFVEREGFVTELAAQRLVKYWKLKFTVFGPEKCFLPLTLGGAMKGEKDGMLKYCPFHVVPGLDTAGRAIILMEPSRRDLSKYSTKSASMALWYMVEAATENPEVKGFVILVNHEKEEIKMFDPALVRFFTNFLVISPVPCRSIHTCYPSRTNFVLFLVAKRLISREIRLRLKLHYGSKEKVLRDLEGYCLPRDRVPAELGGNVVLDIKKWLNERSLLENQREACRGRHLDRATGVDAEGRATKRMRNESELSVRCGFFLSVDSSLRPVLTNHAQMLSSAHATFQLPASIRNEAPNIDNITGATSQGEKPHKSIGYGRVELERRDSFYDSIMELPGLDDLGTGGVTNC